MTPSERAESSTRDGIIAGLSAYTIWGLVPVFFKLLQSVPALETIAHRVVWSMLLMAAVLLGGTGYRQVRETLGDGRKLARVAFGSLMVMLNWLIFVYGINTNQILATSLGYFILPMLNVALGVFVLGERLRPLQWAAVAFAACGILFETWRIGHLPWISLALAGSFGLYGLLRKQLAMDSASGLFLETACMAPLAMAYLLWLEHSGAGHFTLSTSNMLLLVASGAVTAIPLLLFAISARRLPLNTIGFMQYLAPSISFVVAVMIYDEAFDSQRAIGFGAIWLGVLVYSTDLWRQSCRAVPASL
jgi:chloramphenicol-sensitive protein RarD